MGFFRRLLGLEPPFTTVPGIRMWLESEEVKQLEEVRQRLGRVADQLETLEKRQVPKKA